MKKAEVLEVHKCKLYIARNWSIEKYFNVVKILVKLFKMAANQIEL